MKRNTDRKIKNVAIFILSAALLTTLMILGPFYLESCLQNIQTAEASHEVPGKALPNNPITLNSEYFEWKVSIDTVYGKDFNRPAVLGKFYSLSIPLPSFNTPDKIVIDSITQADATTK